LSNLPNTKKFSDDKRPTSSVYAQSFQRNQAQNNLTKKTGFSNATGGQTVATDFKWDLATPWWRQMATVLLTFLMAKTIQTIFKTLKNAKHHIKKQITNSKN